jgi:hypothetical protein
MTRSGKPFASISRRIQVSATFHWPSVPAAQGVVIARIEGSAGKEVQYEAIRFVLEGTAWKVEEESFSQSPVDPRSLYALLPPPDGAFARAGSPWSGIPYADSNTKFFKENELPWKMQAMQDESYLYVRFETKSSLPASGTEIHADDHLPGAPVKSDVPSSPGE